LTSTRVEVLPSDRQAGNPSTALEEQVVIVTIARVTDPDRFLEIFETIGAEKRREHGCRGARVYFDPDDAHRAWSVFDWDAQDYEGFLADPEIPAIARELGLLAPPVHAVAAAELDA
jgi:quinol monooxygenase YgiN